MIDRKYEKAFMERIQRAVREAIQAEFEKEAQDGSRDIKLAGPYTVYDHDYGREIKVICEKDQL